MKKDYSIKTLKKGMKVLDIEEGIMFNVYDNKKDYINMSIFNCNRDYIRLSLPANVKDKIQIVYH